jgi:hypothetical protein
MLIEAAKKKAVGAEVKGLDVVVTTAGQVEKADGKYEQKIGLTDSSGHIWAIALLLKNTPIIRGNGLLVKSATVDIFTNKGGEEEKRLLISKCEIPTTTEPPEEKRKAEGILDPMVEQILEKHGIPVTEALWPLTRKNRSTGEVTTTWIIFHRYCEQIRASAGIVINDPEVVKDGSGPEGDVVLRISGRLGYVEEWSYGEASPKTTKIPYPWAMAEKRGKDRVILKLAGFHGTVYSEFEADWRK